MSSASVSSPGLDRSESPWIGARPPRAIDVIQRVVAFPRLLLAHRDFISTSVRRGLEARFQGTLLGWVWPLVQPLFLFTVYYFIFTKLLQFKIPALPAGEESALGIYMFVGVMTWTAFAEAVGRGTNAIVENGNLIKKLAFPSELLTLNVTLVGIVTQLFALAVFVLACCFTPIWTAPGPELLWLPLLLLLQGLFTYGLTLFLSTLQVFLRDTVQLVGMLLTVWMFATPLFWAPELVGPAFEPYEALLVWNPIHHLVLAWRGALMGDLAMPESEPPGYIVSTAGIPSAVLVFSAWAIGAFVVGYAFFVLSQRRFADEV